MTVLLFLTCFFFLTASDSPASAAAGKPSGRSASTGTDKASVCAAFGRAEVYIDRAEGHYADLHNYLLSRAQGGAQDISEDDWNAMVLPHAKKVVMFTNLAMRELESVMPEKISADFWRNVRYDVYQQWEWGVDVFKKMGFYKSEYMLVFAGYENYIQMYRIIMYSKWEMISNAKDEMLELKKQL